MLAASLVLSTGSDKTGPHGQLAALPRLRDDSDDSFDVGFGLTKPKRGRKGGKETGRSKARVVESNEPPLLALPREGGHCPTDMVPVAGAYCIDPFEASLVEVA